jgi:hypothetical protein
MVLSALMVLRTATAPPFETPPRAWRDDPWRGNQGSKHGAAGRLLGVHPSAWARRKARKRERRRRKAGGGAG